MGEIPKFERFIALDWSGAKTGYGRKIQIAICEEGRAAPRLIRRDKGWTRLDVLNWLQQELRAGPATLVGFDFSFAPPFIDRGAFLPGESDIAAGRDFWAYVDHECNDEDLGAVSFLEKRRGAYFYLGKADGSKSPYMRLRACEKAFNAQGGGKPSSIFDAIGAAQVAKASFSGMRLLHHLCEGCAIWPFVNIRDARSVVVEIYCRLFLRAALGNGFKVRDFDTLNGALNALYSGPVKDHWDHLSDDESDALIASAGLRLFAKDEKYWNPGGLWASVRASEGWTFGVLG